ncbi:MAG TPA: SsrA-binding protein SmpB [Ferrovibrio sp.]|uniref:SsrA-binding protein SmpB n=1 Tax=Ferrovibrio sp. TaxID=1917215 RepID=UPI002B4B50C6|nr:SsrA-binding protein SmpB [Ferrovibrio sp.]HLT75977.1 SsrA-binding protein SmpB [Ferrovibrio sp.]
MAQQPRTVADNRRARFDYHLDETFDAGIVLVGSEVKSLRSGRASIQDAYATEQDGEIWLINSHIPEYHGANRFNHEPRRQRKLLLKRKEIGKLIGSLKRGGVTLVPLSIYFNERGRAKVKIALARGKKLHDKRETEKTRDWNREKQRLLRDRG